MRSSEISCQNELRKIFALQSDQKGEKLLTRLKSELCLNNT